MSIGIGRGGSGSGGGGSSRVGFVSGKQSSTDLSITNHASNFTNASFNTPSWQLTLRNSGRAEVVFGMLIVLSGAASTTNVRYSARLQVSASDSQSTGFTTWNNVEVLPSDGGLIFDEMQDYSGEANIYHTIQGSLPFELDDLPSGATDNKYLRFRLQVRVNADGSPTGIAGRNGFIALKSFGVGAGSTDVGPSELGLSEGAGEANKFVTYNSTGTGFGAKDKITTGDITDSAIQPKHLNGLVNDPGVAGRLIGYNEAGDGFVEIDHDNLASLGNMIVATANIRDGAVTTPKLADDAVTPAKMGGITTGSGAGGYAIALNSAGDGFVSKAFPSGGGGGGGITSVDPSDLDGVTGGSGDANKFIKTNSTGNEFEAQSGIAASDLGLTNGGTDAGKFIQLDSAGTGFTAHGDFTPDDLGLTEGSGIGGRLVSVNSAGTGFTTTSAQQGGAAPTLDNISGGPLALGKGGTGYNASDLSALRTRLGIGAGGSTDPELVRSTNADTQKDHTIHRFDANTANRPTGATNGIIVREGNDQYMVNVDDGKTWKRTISNTGTGQWTTPVAATLSKLQTESDFRTLGEGSRGWADSDSTAWLPTFTDGSNPQRVIVGRNGNYLVCIDRNNMFWALRPTTSTWTSIPWRWEGNSVVPAGLEYTGGENDERLIPAGEDAVISGKTGIDGEQYITLLVDHSVSGGTSTFTGYFIDDDASKTIRSTTNTVGNTTGSWERTRLDVDGISDDIMVNDASQNEPVFLGIVPSIDNLTFSGYTFITTGSPSTGQVAYYASQRGLRIGHASGHDHLNKLLQTDVELQIRKDASNYIRGVFDQITNVPGGGGATQARFRQEGLEVVGTINSGDTVSILGHKAVFTKLEQIPTINIKDDAVTQAKIADDAVGADQLAAGAVGTAALADDAVTPAKIAGVTTGSSEANKSLVLNSAGNGFTTSLITGGGGGPIADRSITLSKLASLYKVLNDGYTFQADTSSGVDDGKFGYVDNGLNGQIAFNVKAGDASAITEWQSSTIKVLYKDSDNFVVGRQSGNATTLGDDSTEGAFNITEIERKGTFADGDSVSLYYGSGVQPGGVIQIDRKGDPMLGNLLPSSMGISPISSLGGRVIATNANSDGFIAAPAANVGMVKEILFMRQSWAGNVQDLEDVGLDRVTISNRQTPTWVVSNKSTDWFRVNATGLYYFGSITAQPICADLQLWVRWKSGTQSYQAWSLSNARVEAVTTSHNNNGLDDRLQIVKLSAGGVQAAHVDCALSTGTKLFKLSELPSAITDGTDVQFTVGFAKQNPSPDFNVRNFFLEIDILDGSKVFANY